MQFDGGPTFWPQIKSIRREGLVGAKQILGEQRTPPIPTRKTIAAKDIKASFDLSQS